MPNSKLKKGRFGKFNPAFHFQSAATLNTDILSTTNVELMTSTQTLIADIQSNKANVLDDFYLGTNKSFENKIMYKLSDDDEKKAEEELKKMTNHLNTLEQDENYAPIKGFIKLLKSVSDPEKGPYCDIIQDNPYLPSLRNSTNGAPKFTTHTIPELVEHAGEPLQLWDNYYGAVGELFDCESERYDINEDYTPQKEQAYLAKLSQALENTIVAFEKCEEFVTKNCDKDGNTPFDQYFDNKLDHLTDVKIPNTGTRGAEGHIGHLRGMKQAIENGWGMNELAPFGFIGEFEALAKSRLRLAETIQLPNAADDAEKEKYNEAIKQYKDFLKNLDVLKKDVLEKKAPSDAEKIDSINKIEDFIEKNKNVINKLSKVSVIKDHIAKAKTGIRDRLLVKDEIGHELITAEDCKENNLRFIFSKSIANSGMVMEKINKSLYNDMILGQNPDNLNHTQLLSDDYCDPINPRKYFPWDYNGVETLHHKFSDETGKDIAMKWITELNKSFSRLINNPKLDDDYRFALPMIKLLAIPTDIESGNFMQAILENPTLTNATAITAGLPDIFALKGIATNYKSPKEIKEKLTRQGILPHLMDLLDGIKDVFEAEYYKQKNVKNAKDEKAKKHYLDLLYAANRKCISSFEKLLELDASIHGDHQTGYMGNELAQLTGKGSSTQLRDMRAQYEAMKWQNIAIKNGWGPENIGLMSAFGVAVGQLERHKTFLETQLEILKDKSSPEYKTAEKNLNAVKEWEEKEIRPLAEMMKSKKCNSPEDVLDIATSLQQFYERNKITEQNKEQVNTYIKLIVNAGISRFTDMISSYKNAAIDEIQKKKEYELTHPKKFEETAIVVNRNELGEKGMQGIDVLNNDDDIIKEPVPETPYKESLTESILGNLRTGNNNNIFTTKDVIEICRAYFRQDFLDSLDQNLHPEFFDETNPRYKAVHAALDKEVKNYVNEALAAKTETISKEVKNGIFESPKKVTTFGIKLENGGDIADFLEHGGHHLYYEDLLNKTDARATKMAYANAANNKIFSENKVKTLEEALQGMKDANTITGKKLFAEARDGLKALISQKKDLIRNIRENYVLGKPLDLKKLNKIIKDQEKTLKTMSTYIDQKNEKIAKNESLGKTGQKRLDAVKDAYASLSKYVEGLKVIAGKPFDKDMVNANSVPDYRVDNQYIKLTTDAQKKMMVKKRADEIDSLLEDTANKRNNLDPKAEDYSEKLLDSALYTIYLDRLKDNSFAAKSSRALSADSSEFMAFKTNLLSPKNEAGSKFVTEFKKQLSEAAHDDTLSTEDILNCRMNAVEKMYETAAKADNPRRMVRDTKRINSFVKTIFGKKTIESNELLSEKAEIKHEAEEKKVKQKKAGNNILG